MAGLHQVGHHRDICTCLIDTLLQSPGAVTHLKANVPEEPDKVRDLRGFKIRILARSKNQEVNIGTRMEFSASITPNRSQGNSRALRWARDRALPQGREHFVNEVTV